MVLSLNWVAVGRVTLCLSLATPPAHAILAGGEFALPVDRPSLRLDPLGAASTFNFIGGLEIFSGGNRYLGTATALSPHWVLTAGHNVDFNDDGRVDDGLSATFHLPGWGSFAASTFTAHPEFAGFGQPTVAHDLALLYFADPLPAELFFPVLGLGLEVGEVVTLVGFGRSGYGSYGYTTQASLTDRRIGFNTVESLTLGADGRPAIFRYTFHGPETAGQPGGSLGNHLETIIGPGDSGGPLLVAWTGSHALVGVNTFVEGYGGRFGDLGGGIVLEPYWDWIAGTTGLAVIPEPGTWLLLGLGLGWLLLWRKRNGEERTEESKGSVRNTHCGANPSAGAPSLLSHHDLRRKSIPFSRSPW